MIDTTAANTMVSEAKDAELELTVTLIDGTEHTGDPISVNSKGVNLKIDGKVRSFGLSRIDSLSFDNGEDDEAEGDDLEDIYAELHDGMTTAELAALISDHLNMDLDAKELRVHLRALGLGVGKGRKYSLSASEFRMVKDLISAPTA